MKKVLSLLSLLLIVFVFIGVSHAQIRCYESFNNGYSTILSTDADCDTTKVWTPASGAQVKTWTIYNPNALHNCYIDIVASSSADIPSTTANSIRVPQGTIMDVKKAGAKIIARTRSTSAKTIYVTGYK